MPHRRLDRRCDPRLALSLLHSLARTFESSMPDARIRLRDAFSHLTPAQWQAAQERPAEHHHVEDSQPLKRQRLTGNTAEDFVTPYSTLDQVCAWMEENPAVRCSAFLCSNRCFRFIPCRPLRRSLLSRRLTDSPDSCMRTAVQAQLLHGPEPLCIASGFRFLLPTSV